MVFEYEGILAHLVYRDQLFLQNEKSGFSFLIISHFSLSSGYFHLRVLRRDTLCSGLFQSILLQWLHVIADLYRVSECFLCSVVSEEHPFAHILQYMVPFFIGHPYAEVFFELFKKWCMGRSLKYPSTLTYSSSFLSELLSLLSFVETAVSFCRAINQGSLLFYFALYVVVIMIGFFALIIHLYLLRENV